MHKIGYVVFPGFQLLGFAAVTAFEMANLQLGEPAYQIELLSQTGGSRPLALGSTPKPSTTARLTTP